MKFDDELSQLLPELVEIRHDIHKHPELGFEEERTQEVVRAWLERHGYEPRDCAETGLVADLRPGQGPCIALRADLDCLPIQETTELPYRSVHQGRSHKCGHDGHTTILMGTAALLAAKKDEVQGNVRLIFQPAEEGVRGGGARVMVEQGALEGVQEVYGLHNWPGWPKGQVRVAAGPLMAQADRFNINVIGKGGHGSQPHLCNDPIIAACQLVSSLQTIVSRNVDYGDSAVVSIGELHAGTAANIIPDRVRISGTTRTFDEAVADRVHRRLKEIVDGVAQTFGVKCELDFEMGYPVLVNDAGCAEAVRRVASGLVGPERVLADALPMAGGEDFAYFAQAVPGAYFFLGAQRPGEDTPVCHHPDFDFDDELIPTGVKMFMGLVAERLKALSP